MLCVCDSWHQIGPHRYDQSAVRHVCTAYICSIGCCQWAEYHRIQRNMTALKLTFQQIGHTKQRRRNFGLNLCESSLKMNDTRWQKSNGWIWFCIHGNSQMKWDDGRTVKYRFFFSPLFILSTDSLTAFRYTLDQHHVFGVAFLQICVRLCAFLPCYSVIVLQTDKKRRACVCVCVSLCTVAIGQTANIRYGKKGHISYTYAPSMVKMMSATTTKKW